MHCERQRGRISARRGAVPVAFSAQRDSNRVPPERQRECEPAAAAWDGGHHGRRRCAELLGAAELSGCERDGAHFLVEPVVLARASRRRWRRRPVVPGVRAVRPQACHLVLVHMRLDALRLVRARRRALPRPRSSGAPRRAAPLCM